MKKFKIAFVWCTMVCAAFAQPYGHTNYQNGAALTGATTTSLHSSGFLMAGTTSTGVTILKTGNGGSLSGANNFQRDYALYVDGSCISTTTGTPPIIGGISVIETQNMVSWYAAVGAFENGIFFSRLSPSGQWGIVKLYGFPYVPTVTTTIEKPLIVQSQNNSNDFFICGRFDTSMYVMRIDTSGNTIWSSFYSAGGGVVSGSYTGGIFRPLAIIESPFNGDVVITGYLWGSPSYNRANDGFFLSLDPNNGGALSFKSYGDYLTGLRWCNSFSAITPAYSTSGGAQGYVMAGDSDPSGSGSNNGRGWLVKVDTSGNQIWNYQYTGSYQFGNPNNDLGAMCGVVERHDITANRYEYYALSFNGNYIGMDVYKINEDGKPLSAVFTTLNDLFIYPSTTTSPIVNAKAITYNQGTGMDDGLHLYGDDTGNFSFIEAYFNGVSGCSEMLQQIQSYEAGLGPISPWINLYGSITGCVLYQGVLGDQASLTLNPNVICSNSSIGAGSNSRVIAGVNEQGETVKTKVYPNPGSGNYVVEIESRGTASIYNSFGEILNAVNLEEGVNKLDLSAYEKGLYNVVVFDGYSSKTIKLIKN